MLRKFAVPRISLPKCEMSIPLIISEIEEEDQDMDIVPVLSIAAIAKELAVEAIRVISGFPSVKENISDEEIKKVSGNIEAKLRDMIIGRRKHLPRIRVSPLTSQIREVGNAENFVTLKLSLVEEALELTITEVWQEVLFPSGAGHLRRK